MSISSLFWNNKEKRLTALLRILAFILIASALSIPIGILGDSMNDFVEKSFTNLFIMVAMLLALYLSGKFIDKREWKEFGITFKPWRQFLSGAGVGALLMILIFGTQYFSGWLKIKEVNFNRLPEYGFWMVMIGQVVRYISGSVFEEAFSRGYLLRNIAEGFDGILSKDRAVMLAYFISSSLFGILHLGNDHATFLSTLNLILIGLLFGWMVVQTGKLHFAIGLHAAWNLFQNNIFGAPNSGKAPVASLVTFENTGSILWTGRDFGPEGGLICTLVVGSWLLISIFSSGKPFKQRILN